MRRMGRVEKRGKGEDVVARRREAVVWRVNHQRIGVRKWRL